VTVCPRCGSELVPPFRFCPKCGADLTPAGWNPYGYAQPPKANHLALIVIAIVVVVILIPMVLAGILYVMVSGLISSPHAPGSPGSRPVLTIVLNTQSNTGADVLVSGAQPAVSYSNYRLNLGVNFSYGSAQTLAAAGVPAYFTAGSATYAVTWQNPSGSGNLVAGDHFTLSYPASGTSGPQLSFLLLWFDGIAISTVQWRVA
jgi:hypothetical protein